MNVLFDLARNKMALYGELLETYEEENQTIEYLTLRNLGRFGVLTTLEREITPGDDRGPVVINLEFGGVLESWEEDWNGGIFLQDNDNNINVVNWLIAYTRIKLGRPAGDIVEAAYMDDYDEGM